MDAGVTAKKLKLMLSGTFPGSRRELHPMTTLAVGTIVTVSLPRV